MYAELSLTKGSVGWGPGARGWRLGIWGALSAVQSLQLIFTSIYTFTQSIMNIRISFVIWAEKCPFNFESKRKINSNNSHRIKPDLSTRLQDTSCITIPFSKVLRLENHSARLACDHFRTHWAWSWVSTHNVKPHICCVPRTAKRI